MLKKLPMSNPIIQTYPKHAHITSILAKHENFNEWLFTNHVQLFCARYTGETEYDSYLDTYEPLHRVYYPLLEMQSMNKDLYNANKINTVDFLVNCIDLGYYVYVSVDTSFIPIYSNIPHSIHDLLVFGYDTDRNEFHVADFFDNHYKHEVIGFDSLKPAIESKGVGDNDFKGIQMLKINSNPINPHYNFNITLLKMNLHDYLFEKDTSEKYSEFEGPYGDEDNRRWGLGVYSSLLDILNKDKVPKVTRRSIHALYEHKKLMKMRVKYLMENNYIKKDPDLLRSFEKVEQDALVIRNVFLKSKFAQGYIGKVITLLERLKISDKEAIEQLYNLISV